MAQIAVIVLEVYLFHAQVSPLLRRCIRLYQTQHVILNREEHTALAQRLDVNEYDA